MRTLSIIILFCVGCATAPDLSTPPSFSDAAVEVQQFSESFAGHAEIHGEWATHSIGISIDFDTLESHITACFESDIWSNIPICYDIDTRSSEEESME
tara:strand:+ start:3838 stop:4131 length:294 start_codon:yes stop_codon:yes gene_type:complete